MSDAPIPDGGLLRDLPDDAVVHVTRYTDLPHRRYADTAEGLRRLIHEMLATSPTADFDAYEDQIAHELEHAAAARALGCTSRFYFNLSPHPDVRWLWVCYTGHQYICREPLTKLAVAAIAAAPAWLSEGDLADLRSLGYRDAEDVADRIRRHNRRAPRPLPVPASARAR